MPHQGFVHRSWADFQQFDHLLTTHLLNFGLDFPEEPSVENLDSYLQRVMTHSGIVSNNIFHDFLGINWSGRDLTFLQNLPGFMKVSAANRLTGEVVQSRRRPLLNFTMRDRGVNACLALCLNSVLNVKAVVAAFNQEKALVGAFSVIVQLHRLIDLRHYSCTMLTAPL